MYLKLMHAFKIIIYRPDAKEWANLKLGANYFCK